MFKKAEIVNVQLEDAVPETSFLHSKYWTMYRGNYRLGLTFRNFLYGYFNINREFKAEMPSFFYMDDDKDVIYVTFSQEIKAKGYTANFPVLSWGMRPTETGLITVCYYNVFNIQKPTKERIYNYLDYYKKHKNPVPYGFDVSNYCSKEVRTKQIWIEDFSDLDKVIKVIRPYAEKQKEELLKNMAMFDELEKIKYTEIMENYKKQIADLNKMRNEFTDKTVETIFKQINLQGDF